MTESIVEPPETARPRRRLRPALIAMALGVVVLGAWLMYLSQKDRWPARLTLTTSQGSQPLGFSPDGRTFLTVGREGIVPWDLVTGTAGKPWVVPFKGVFYDGTFSLDGRTYAAAVPSHPGLLKIYLFDVASGRMTVAIEAEQVAASRLSFSSDGRSLKAVLGDSSGVKQVATWDVATGRETSRRVLATVPGKTLPASLGYPWSLASPDGRVLATTSIRAKDVEFLNLDADRVVGTLVKPTGQPNSFGMAFSDDGKTLAIGRLDGSIELRDVATRALLKTIPVHQHGYESDMIRFLPHGLGLVSIGRYRQGSQGLPGPLGRLSGWLSRVLSGLDGNRDVEMIFVDLATNRLTPTAPSTIYPILSPDGRTMATRDRDLRIKIRDVLPPER